MMAQQPTARNSPLRILEIGGDTLFARAVPYQTEFYRSAPKPRGLARRALGPLRFFNCIRDLRQGKYDLLAVHTAQYAPWHWRSLLTTLRDWHIRAPVALFALFAWRFIHLFHDVPIVAVDLGDSFGIGSHNFFLLRASRAFFKRELPADHWQCFHRSGSRDYPGRRWRSKEGSQELVAKLKPLSYGTYVRMTEIAPEEKTVDIFFAGAVAANSTVRTAGIAELRALEREGYTLDIPAERLEVPEFLRRMGAAWLAWSPQGLGWECSRHYEAPLVHTVPLINYPTIVRDRPLQDSEHCVLYAVEPGGLTAAARRALSDKPRLQRMAAAAAAHVRRHHSDYARADRVAVAVLGRHLDGSPARPDSARDACAAGSGWAAAAAASAPAESGR
jgi:hypothetical protein